MVGKKDLKGCPNCGEFISANAVKCKHCKSIMDIIPGEKTKTDQRSVVEIKKEDQEKKTEIESVEEPTKEENSDEGEESAPVSDNAEKGFFSALFDPSMKQMITPQIVSVLFVIGLFAYTFIAVITVTGFIAASNVRMLVLAIIAVPIGFFIFIIIMRVSLEMIVVIFRIYDELRRRV